MRVWGLAHGKDGWMLHVIEAPAWRVALEDLGVPVANFLTGHLLCCNIPSVAWEIPLGPPRRDSEGFLDNSLGGQMFNLGQWLNARGTFRHESKEEWVPVHPDLAFRLDPEFFAEVQSIWND